MKTFIKGKVMVESKGQAARSMLVYQFSCINTGSDYIQFCMLDGKSSSLFKSFKKAQIGDIKPRIVLVWTTFSKIFEKNC